MDIEDFSDPRLATRGTRPVAKVNVAAWIEFATRDVRLALRSIARMPVLAAVVVASIGVGIGVNTVVFSWIQTRVWKPLPGVVDAPSFLWIEPRTEAGSYPGVSWLEYRDLREQLGSFHDLLVFRMAPLYLGDSGRVQRAYGLLVSGNYFSALGVRPVLGRFPQPRSAIGSLIPDPGSRLDPGSGPRVPDPESISEPVAVISYGLWQARFGGAADAVGRTLRVNGEHLTVIGVTPREFQGTVMGLNFDVWLPTALAPVVLKGSRELQERGVRGYTVMGRLQPAATRAGAQSDLDAAMRRLSQAYPATNATLKAAALRFEETPRGPQRLLMNALAILQGIMLLLLFAVCGNTANLVLARASARHREVGVRLALGAGPWRIARLLLTETVVLGLLGAGFGAAIAVWATPALVALPLSGMPIRFQTSVDAFGLAFAMLLGIACGLVFGAAPAMQLARVDPQTALRAGSRTAGRSSLRHALMAIQIALALIVLIVAGLFYRSFMATRDTDTGFRREGVMLAAYDLTGRNATPASSRAFAARLLEKLRAQPGVEAAAIASGVPLDIHGLPSRAFTVDGRARSDASVDQAVALTVTPGYLSLMEIPLLAGTDFADLNDPGAPPQAIVNDEFVRRYLPDAEPIGRRVQARGRSYVIVGVAKTSLYSAFGEPPTPIIYYSYRDAPGVSGEIHLRTRVGSETVIVPEVRRIVSELDADLPVFNVRTLTDHIETNLVFRRVPARLFAVLGPLLLVLAAIGIYAVVAYSVSLRTTEIGVRLALGATVRRLIAQFVGESLIVIGLGALAGWSIAFAVALNFTPGGSIDVPVFAGVPAILLLVAALACWLPIRRATLVEPAVALRQD
jgi:predicted permease